MSLLVLDPGLASRIVDFGRPRARSLGVPVGGAADRRSLAFGNALLGNPLDAPALEVTLQGPHLRATHDLAAVVFGAPFELNCGGERIEAGHTFMIHAGEELHLGATGQGMRAYLCLRGGFHADPILGSRSSLQPLRAGEELACSVSRLHTFSCPDLQPHFPTTWSLRVVPGLQASWFNEAEFYRQTFTITPASDRMGLRLSGEVLTLPERELISEPVCPGALQVTRDGQGILLGVDGQTIGGYPKIAQVIQADLDALGQLRPGNKLSFTKITLAEAIQLQRQAAIDLQRWALRLHLALDAFPAERKLIV